MAITFVGSTSTAVVEQFTFNFALPTSLEDDIVIVVVGSGSASEDTALGVTTAGYTEEASLYANDLHDTNFSVSWKRMGVTPDTSVDCDGSGQIGNGTTAVAYVLRGVDTTTAIDVTTTTATGVNSAIPDCPSITPVSSGALVIACAVGGTNDSSITPPSGYSDHYSKENTTDDGNTTAVCSKEWSGSGAEDPAAWTDWTTDTTRSWCAATLAIRPVSTLSPPTGSLAITGLTPAIGVTPPSGSLTFTAGVPIPAVAIPVFPTTGAITLTGTTPTPITAVAVYPSTEQMQITGGTPRVDHNILDVTLPVITAAFGVQGTNNSLVVTLPVIQFLGSMSEPSVLRVELPAFRAEFFSGSSFGIEIPLQEVLFSSVTGTTCRLISEFTELSFSALSGSNLLIDIPPMEGMFAGINGTVARLIVPLPPVSALFEARVETLSQLVVNLPVFQASFTSQQDILSQLVVTLPTLSTLFGASVGSISTLNVDLPALEALFTRYEDITGQIIVTLPDIRTFLEMSHSGRFDTSTAAEIANTILKWRRPS